MAAAGVQFDPQRREPLRPAAVRQAALQRYLARVATAANSPSASRVQHYFTAVRPGCLAADGYGLPAHATAVRELHRRWALNELRTGVHWGAEDRARLQGRERQRPAAPAPAACATTLLWCGWAALQLAATGCRRT